MSQDYTLRLVIDSVGMPQTVSDINKVTGAIEHGTAAHEPHIRGLSRIGNSLSSLVGHATGVPPVLERIGDSLGIMAFGHLATVGVLAGFAAIAFAYEKITEKAKEAAEQVEKTEAAITDAANAGKTDPIRDAARRLQFGTPFDKDHKLVPLSEYAAGAFEGSLADLQGKLASLQAKFYATTNGFTQLQIQKQIVGVKQALVPMQKLMADMQAAAANVLSQPGDNAGTLGGVVVKALSAGALDKAFEKWAMLQERQIKGLSLAGELGAARVGQLEDEAAQWRAVAAGLGVANPQYERYMALAKAADDLVRKNADLSDTSSRAHMNFAAAFKPPPVVSPGDSARMGLLDGIIPDPKILADNVRYAIDLAADAVRNSPIVKMMEAIKELAGRMKDTLGQVLGQGLADGLEAAFSGKGISNAFKTLAATVFNGLGSFMIQLGSQMIIVGIALDALAKSLLTLNGPGAIAAGVALIAAGAGLRAIASSFGGGSSASGGDGAGSYGSTPTPSFLSFGVQASSPTTSMSAPGMRSATTFTIIGPDDPKAQRAIADIVNKADSRGLIGAGR